MGIVSETIKELTGHIIPFWNRMKDETNGGFYGFTDFDLNFNQHEILMETRISGMLTKPYSALVLEFKAASGSSNDNNDNEPSG